MVTNEEYLQAIKIITEYKEQLRLEYNKIQHEVDVAQVNANTVIEDLDNMSVRLFNVLRYSARIKTIGDLANYTIKDLYKLRGFGVAAEQELFRHLDIACVKLKN